MMDGASGYEVLAIPSKSGKPGESPEYRLLATKFLDSGRTRELWRAVGLMVALFVLQYPMRQVAVGHWDAAIVSRDVAGRLSLIVDVAFILAELTVAYRTWGLVRSRWPSCPWIVAAKFALAMVILGTSMDVLEDTRLWALLGATTSTPTLSLTFGQAFWAEDAEATGTPWFSLVMCVVTVVGLGLGLLLTWKCPKPRPKPSIDAAVVDRPGVVICCSGGGIRASAFSLGGLQELQKADVYEHATAVVGVSGGGYIAAAHHVVRWLSGDGEKHWQLAPKDAFASGSPELQYLRRHSRYIMNSASDVIQAALSLAFGIAVNVLLMITVIGGTAWILGWLFVVSGRLHPWTKEPVGGDIHGKWDEDWSWLSCAWLVPAAGIALFLVQKFIDRYWTLGARSRWIKPSFLRIPSQWLIVGGVTLTVLILGVPWAVDALAEFTANSANPVAGLLYNLGFVPEEICKAAVEVRDACGVPRKDGVASPTTLNTVGSVSIAAVVSSILAVLASARSASSAKEPIGGGMSGFLGKFWAKVKDPVVPYLAVTVITAVVIFSLLRWIVRLVARPDDLDNWLTALVIGLLLLTAKCLTDANRTSLHHYFRERISDAFLVSRKIVHPYGRVDTVDYRKPLRFSESRPPTDKGPRLVTCAVANVTDQDLVPSRRGCTPFVFDHERMGLTDRMLPDAAARRPSKVYEFAADEGYRDATIPAAIAISAAAFSPLAGRENVRLGPYRAVLALGNARLGVWLPNPMWMDERQLLKRMVFLGEFPDAAVVWGGLDEEEKNSVGLTARTAAHLNALVAATPTVAEKIPYMCVRRAWVSGRSIFKKPSVTRLFKEAVGKASAYDRFPYVTDGGHYDNLGLIEALRRKPKEIFVLDASNDKEDAFSTLGQAIATARMDLDCEVKVNPRPMRRREEARSPSAWCTGTYEFTSGETGLVHIAKAIMLDGLSWDVETYASANLQFPRTSTANQLYSEFDFEAYRELGASTVDKLLSSYQYRIAKRNGPPPQ